jgi:hypothetical protein
MVEEGWIGLAAWLVMLALLVKVRRRGDSPARRLEDGIIASLAALLAVALVDFPLHRPTELYLLWTYIALLWSEDGDQGAPALTSPEPSRSGPEEKRRSK